MKNLIWSNVIDMADWEEQVCDMHPEAQDEAEKFMIAKAYNDDEYDYIVKKWDIPAADVMAVGVIEFDDGYKTEYKERIGDNLANIFRCDGAEIAEWYEDNGIVGKFWFADYSISVRYYVKCRNAWEAVASVWGYAA